VSVGSSVGTVTAVAVVGRAGRRGIDDGVRRIGIGGGCNVERSAVVDRGFTDGTGRRRRIELGVHDDPLSSGVLRMAGRERQRGAGGIGRRDHLVVARRDDLLAGHPVDEASGQGGDDDLVADLELVDVEERLAERGAVTGDRRVAELARHRRVRIVAGSLLQVVLLHPGDHDLVDADGRQLETGDRVALGDWWQAGDRHRLPRRWWRGSNPSAASRPGVDCVSRRWRGGRRRVDGRCGGRRRAGEELLELVLQRVLRAGGLDAGAPQLIRDEREHQQSRGDQCLADASDPPSPVVWRSGSIELARPRRVLRWWFVVRHGHEPTCAMPRRDRGGTS
jgi:hypothetical protein